MDQVASTASNVLIEVQVGQPVIVILASPRQDRELHRVLVGCQVSAALADATLEVVCLD